MFRPGPVSGVADSLLTTAEPPYVIAFTLLNAVIVSFVVIIHLDRVRRQVPREKPGRRPE